MQSPTGMPNLLRMRPISPPVLVPVTSEKTSLGFKPSGGRSSCSLMNFIRRLSMSREERPRTPPPSRVRILVALGFVGGIRRSHGPTPCGKYIGVAEVALASSQILRSPNSVAESLVPRGDEETWRGLHFLFWRRQFRHWPNSRISCEPRRSLFGGDLVLPFTATLGVDLVLA